jgi:hypothetical protein
VRIPGPLAIVAIAIGVAALVAAVTVLGHHGEGHAPRPNPSEIAAVGYAESYADALAHGQAGQACAVAGGAAAGKLGCGTANPRLPPSCGEGKVTIIEADIAHAELRIAKCHLTLSGSNYAYKVVDDKRD